MLSPKLLNERDRKMEIVIISVQYVPRMRSIRLKGISENLTMWKSRGECKKMWPDHNWQEVIDHPGQVFEV